MKKLIILTLLLAGCASTPMTNDQCKQLGGDTTVYFHADNKWRCCKVVEVNKKTYCQEVTQEEKRGPRNPIGPGREPRP